MTPEERLEKFDASVESLAASTKEIARTLRFISNKMHGTEKVCGFCGSDVEEADILILGDTFAICDGCVDHCNKMIAETKAKRAENLG